MLTLFMIMRYENNRRDKAFGAVDQTTLAEVEEEVIATDRTDVENKAFRYMM